MQRDVPLFLGQFNDESRVRIQALARVAGLVAGPSAHLPEPARSTGSLSKSRHRNGTRHAEGKAHLQRPSQHAREDRRSKTAPSSPPSTGRLNQHSTASSHHNRFNDQRNRSRAYKRACREEHGWTQEILGQKVGASQQQISEYENGADRISLDMLIQLGLIFLKTFDQYIAAKEAVGFSTPEAPPYMLDLPTSAPSQSDSNRVEAMFLDLRKLRDPMDRESLQAQYLTMPRKQETACSPAASGR